MVKKKACVFISGQGSNLKNLISQSRDNSFPIKISLVVSNNKSANGIKFAKKIIYLTSISILRLNIMKIRFY